MGDKSMNENQKIELKKAFERQGFEVVPSREQFKKIVGDLFRTQYKQEGYKISQVYNKLSKDLGYSWHSLSVALVKYHQ